MALFLSVGALKPASAKFLQADALQQLRLPLAVDETTLAAELLVGRPFFAKKFTADCTVAKCTQVVTEIKEAFPNIYCLYMLERARSVSLLPHVNTLFQPLLA